MEGLLGGVGLGDPGRGHLRSLSQWGRLYVWAGLGRAGEDLGIVKRAELQQSSPQWHQGLRGVGHTFNESPPQSMPGGH